MHPDPIQTRAHWDQMAGSYDEAKRRNDGYYAALKRCFQDAIGPEYRERILDVGCGTGQILASLKPAHGLGIDLSPSMIQAAQRTYQHHPNLTFQTRSATQAGGGRFDDVWFDAVISADMLEHVDDWRSALSAMVQACRPQGVVAITTPNPGWAPVLWMLEKLGLKMPEGPHRFIPASAIAHHLRELGVTITTMNTHALLPTHLGGIGPAVSNLASRAPILRRCGVIQLVVGIRQKA